MIDWAAETLDLDCLVRDDEGEPLPPWRAFPDIGRHSIGWRMGPGEDYWMAFHGWLRELAPDEIARYVIKYPESGEWSGFYATIAID